LFARDCERYRGALKQIIGNATGKEFALAVREWMDGRTALASDRGVVARLKQQYDSALKAYEAAAAAAERSDSKEGQDGFEEGVKALNIASEAVEKAGGFLGVKVISEERLDQINAVIGAVQGDQLDPKQYDASVRSAVGVVATLPTFADRALDIARR